MQILSWRLILLGLFLFTPARANNSVWYEPLWLQPPGADAPFPVLLVQPAGWQPGDAAVVVIPDPAGSRSLQDRVVRILLETEAAVVELDPAATQIAMPAMLPYPALEAAARMAALQTALRLLRTETGAGLLVVLGLGQAGTLALAVVTEPNLAAAIALGPEPRYLPGAPPPPAEHWPKRAKLLCDALAGVAAEAAESGQTVQDCREALLR